MGAGGKPQLVTENIKGMIEQRYLLYDISYLKR